MRMLKQRMISMKMWINSKGIVNFTILFQRPERDTNVDMGKLGTMNDNGERLSSFEQLSF